MNIKPTTTWGFTSRLDWNRLFRDFNAEGARVARITCKEAPAGQTQLTLVKMFSAEDCRLSGKVTCVGAVARGYLVNVYFGDQVSKALGAHTYDVETWR